MSKDRKARVEAANAVFGRNHPQQPKTLSAVTTRCWLIQSSMARFVQAKELAFDTAHQRPDLAQAAYAACRILGLENPDTTERILMMTILESVSKTARRLVNDVQPTIFEVLGISSVSSSPA